jgi:hypothetical protein
MTTDSSIHLLPVRFGELSELSEGSEPRTFHPRSFIKPDTVAMLESLPLHPWDVMPASQFLTVLGASDKMLANRWLYRSVGDAPPFEPPGRWRSGPGAPRVIRKDRAIAWAAGADSPQGSDCWPYAAGALSALGWPGLDSAQAVQEVLTFLIRSHLISLAVQPVCASEVDRLYA